MIYPRINPNETKDNELTGGHTHFFLVGNRSSKNEKSYRWGEESAVKYALAQRISEGRQSRMMKYSCRIVTVLVGDNPECHRDVAKSLELGIPIIVLQGSSLSEAILAG